MAGSYQVVSELVGIKGRTDRPGHLYFSPAPETEPSETEQSFKREVEEVASVLRKLLQTKSPDDFAVRFEELLGLARLGLLVGQGHLAEASSSLRGMKESLVKNEGQHIRSKYLSRLLLIAVVTSVIFLIIFALARSIAEFVTDISPSGGLPGAAAETEAKTNIFAMGVRSYSLMLVGAMIGLWVSFALRKNFTFEHLFLPEDDLLSPIHRTVFVIVATAILALFCSQNIIDFSLWNFQTKNLASEMAPALSFGVLCGLAQNFLSDIVLPHIKSFAESMGKKPTTS
jgi:hypothetical protein